MRPGDDFRYDPTEYPMNDPFQVGPVESWREVFRRIGVIAIGEILRRLLGALSSQERQ